MKEMIKRLIVPGILALGLTACNQETEPIIRTTDPQAIKITVSDPNGILTKAEEDSCTVLFEDVYLGKVSEEDSLLVSAYVEDNLTIPFELEEELTKGTINDVEVLMASSFAMNGWLDFGVMAEEDLKGQSDSDKEDYRFINGASVSYSGGKWSLNQTALWRDNVPSTFWSYYPSSLTTLVSNIVWPGKTAAHADQSSVKFDYTLPLPSSDDDKTSAVKTQDILFAYNYQKVKICKDPNDKENFGKIIEGNDELDIHFYHTMAAVRFDISRLVAADVEINEIFIEDVAKEGSCAVSANGTNGVNFVWTVDYTKKSGKLVQTYSGSDFKGTGLVNEGDVKNPENSLQNDGNKFFFFIPQTVKGKDIKIGLTYTGKDGLPKVAETTLSHEQPWEAGKLYTYKLSTTADKIDVLVEDDVEQFDKNNLAITNTGTTVEYIRALLIGAYCETDKTQSKQTADKGAIVYSWDPDDTNLGTFEGYPGDGWVKGSDGFWYYTKPVDPEDATSQLFEAYHAYFMPPVGDSHLEINIAAQAVAYDKDKSAVIEAWGVDEITLENNASKTIKDALNLRQ